MNTNKKTLYLWVTNKGWNAFEYEQLSDLKKEFDSRLISIGSDASIGRGAIGVKTILIKGSKHTVNYWGEDKINIGCKQYSVSEWVNIFKQIGNDNGYTDEQVAEYGTYIDTIVKIHESGLFNIKYKEV